MPLGIGVQPIPRIGDRQLFADAAHTSCRRPSARRMVMHVVGRRMAQPLAWRSGSKPLDPRRIRRRGKGRTPHMAQFGQAPQRSASVCARMIEILGRHKRDAVLVSRRRRERDVALPLRGAHLADDSAAAKAPISLAIPGVSEQAELACLDFARHERGVFEVPFVPSEVRGTLPHIYGTDQRPSRRPWPRCAAAPRRPAVAVGMPMASMPSSWAATTSRSRPSAAQEAERAGHPSSTKALRGIGSIGPSRTSVLRAKWYIRASAEAFWLGLFIRTGRADTRPAPAATRPPTPRGKSRSGGARILVPGNNRAAGLSMARAPFGRDPLGPFDAGDVVHRRRHKNRRAHAFGVA